MPRKMLRWRHDCKRPASLKETCLLLAVDKKALVQGSKEAEYSDIVRVMKTGFQNEKDLNRE